MVERVTNRAGGRVRGVTQAGGTARDNGPMPDPQDVPIRDESIRLGQFLKLANLIDHGSEAKELMVQGTVLVNGEVETRRGRRLAPGDVVTVDAPAGVRTVRVGAGG